VKKKIEDRRWKIENGPYTFRGRGIKDRESETEGTRARIDQKMKRFWFLYGLSLLGCIAILWLVLNDTSIQDARGNDTKCEVHHVPLKEDVVPIVYGMIRRTGEESQARHSLFPNAYSTYEAGCVVEKPQKARVRYCPLCREAEKEWEDNTKRRK